jgi:hypothetical protein
MDFIIEGSDLNIPLFSPENGLELNLSSNLMVEIAGAVTCVPQDLTYSLQNLRDGDILLDFSASSMRIGQMIAWTRRNIVCLAEPSDRVEESILPSPRRSAQGSLILATLSKCAILNEILDSFAWEAKPRVARVSQLSTSFIDLKLLIDLDTVSTATPPASVELRSPELSITSFPVQHRHNSFHPTSPTTGLGSPRTMGVQPPLRSGGNISLTHFAGLGGGAASAGGSDQVIKTQTISSRQLVVVNSTLNRQVINVYQVAPLIKYLEMQHRCVLTKGAVEFADRLSRVTRMDFPPYTLLLCPTIFQLLEFWDGLQFTMRLKEESDQRRKEHEANRDAPPGVAGAAIQRKRYLKRAFDLIYAGGISPSPPTAASTSTRPVGGNR